MKPIKSQLWVNIHTISVDEKHTSVFAKYEQKHKFEPNGATQF